MKGETFKIAAEYDFQDQEDIDVLNMDDNAHIFAKILARSATEMQRRGLVKVKPVARIINPDSPMCWRRAAHFLKCSLNKTLQTHSHLNCYFLMSHLNQFMSTTGSSFGRR
jgi:hypothetical protein